jgi:hypothetical protein
LALDGIGFSLGVFRFASEYDLFVEFGDLSAQGVQEPAPRPRNPKRLPRARVGRVAGAFEPVVRLHAEQRWVKCPGAKFVAMFG